MNDILSLQTKSEIESKIREELIERADKNKPIICYETRENFINRITEEIYLVLYSDIPLINIIYTIRQKYNKGFQDVVYKFKPIFKIIPRLL